MDTIFCRKSRTEISSGYLLAEVYKKLLYEIWHYFFKIQNFDCEK